MKNENDRIFFRIRLLTIFFIAGLVLSGVTAFPLPWETGLLVRWFGAGTCVGDRFPALAGWLAYVNEGLVSNAADYPFMAYGTDWLAFGHIVIALFFIGVLLDPVRNVWLVKMGLAACALVPLLAFCCGPLRGIPLWWRVIDSSFGVFGAIPLVLIYRWTRQLEKL